MKKTLFILLLFAGATLLRSGELLPEHLKFQSDGTFSINGISFNIAVADAKWHFKSNKDLKKRVSKIKRSGVKVKGIILPGNGKVSITETVTPLKVNQFELKSTLNMIEKVKLNRVSGNFAVPAVRCSITIDGKNVEIPAPPPKNIRLYSGSPQEVILRTLGAEELVITGILGRVIVQDSRKFRGNRGTVSVMFCFRSSALDLKMTIRRIEMKKIPLEAFINRAYHEHPDNKLPVWTLQGPEESLYMFRPEQVDALNVDFDIPSQGAVAVAGQLRGGAPKSLTIPVNVPKGMRSLNLLHTSAWTPNEKFGEIVVNYADGSNTVFPVSGLRDCGNWCGPRSQNNAFVAWNAARPDTTIGAYLSTFHLSENKRPISVTFRSAHKKVIWFVMGMSFAPKELFLPGKENLPCQIKAGKDWHPLVFRNTTVPGSPLDFSFQLDAPAGKYGYVRPAPDGTLRFEKAPKRRLRLYGTNLCQTANFPPKEMAEAIALQIARNGYNSVRFHHHDKGLVDPKSPVSTTLNPETLDRFDYFFAMLKKHGIYITTDLYTSRKFKKGDGLPELGRAKAWLQSNPVAMKNWKTFARNWMTHRNPYTGMTYAEDPALVMINLVNEDDPLVFWNSSLETRKRHTQLFNEWKKKNGCSSAQADTGDRHFLDFLFELKEKSLAEMTRFAKNELHLQASVTSLNQHQKLYFVPLRDKFDVVDDHGYHDHRSRVTINGRKVNGHHQKSSIDKLSYMPRTMMTTRNPSKPFFMTEFNHCRPNRYRAESGPIMGAYSALQDWDGIYRFCYSHSIKRILKNTEAISCFESVADPIMQLSDRIIAAMFLREDVQSANECFSYAVPENILKTDMSLNFPISFQMLGYITRIGSHVKGHPLPSGTIAVDENIKYSTAGKYAKLWSEVIESKRAVSSTGEIIMDAKTGTFIVNTPRTESVTFSQGSLQTGGILSVSNMTTFGTIAVISLDRKKLANSQNILLLHLTDTANSGDKFFDSNKLYVNKYGKLPLLVRRGRAKVTLNLNATFNVKALSTDGDTLGPVKVKNNTFTVATDLFKAGVMAYHVTR